MTRLAIISDVHADHAALVDALRQIDRMGCERIVCAGDLVDYGKNPEETLTLLRERRIPCIRGNHDRWAKAGGTGDSLSPGSIRFLESLPTKIDLVIGGVRLAVRHARPPEDDMLGIDPSIDLPDDLGSMLFEAGNADVLVVGHTHRCFAAKATGGGLVVNPGALLRDAKKGVHVPTPGTFGILELPSRKFTVHYAFDGAEAPLEGGPRVRP